MSGRILFMGAVEDPELDVWLSRGNGFGVNVYDGTAPLTDADRRLMQLREEERKARPPYTGKRGSFHPGGSRLACSCGNCFFRLECEGREP